MMVYPWQLCLRKCWRSCHGFRQLALARCVGTQPVRIQDRKYRITKVECRQQFTIILCSNLRSMSGVHWGILHIPRTVWLVGIRQHLTSSQSLWEMHAYAKNLKNFDYIWWHQCCWCVSLKNLTTNCFPAGDIKARWHPESTSVTIRKAQKLYLKISLNATGIFPQCRVKSSSVSNYQRMQQFQHEPQQKALDTICTRESFCLPFGEVFFMLQCWRII